MTEHGGGNSQKKGGPELYLPKKPRPGGKGIPGETPLRPSNAPNLGRPEKGVVKRGAAAGQKQPPGEKKRCPKPKNYCNINMGLGQSGFR